LAGATAVSTTARTALEALIASITAAGRDGSNLNPRDVAFTWQRMAQLPKEDAHHFINQSQLGWGNDGAELIAIGTEQTYDLEDNLEPLTLDCGSQIIWLSASKPEVMALSGHGLPFTLEGQATRGPYHINFARYHPGGPTWWRLARIVANQGSDWKMALGQRCYQVELKGEPGRHPNASFPLSERRLQFLRHAMRSLPKTAIVALFHGAGTHGAAQELGALFLGTTTLPPGTTQQVRLRTGVGRCTHHDAGGRRVILSWALGYRRAGGAYADLIRELVRQALDRAATSDVADLFRTQNRLPDSQKHFGD